MRKLRTPRTPRTLKWRGEWREYETNIGRTCLKNCTHKGPHVQTYDAKPLTGQAAHKGAMFTVTQSKVNMKKTLMDMENLT